MPARIVAQELIAWRSVRSSAIGKFLPSQALARAFQTLRLPARRISASDVEAMLAVYGDPVVVRYVADGNPLDRAGCKQWVEITLHNHATRGRDMVALVERATGTIVRFGGLAGRPDGCYSTVLNSSASPSSY